jgi:hypothetical protein
MLCATDMSLLRKDMIALSQTDVLICQNGPYQQIPPFYA